MDDKRESEKLQKDGADLSRPDFLALSVAAGLAAATGSTLAAVQQVVETDVTIKMPDGTCDAAFIHPATGSHPGVLIWADAFGLRPSMREIGKRIAAEGYSVLVPNPFYRKAKAPVIDNPSSFNFQNPADMAKLQPLMASINAPGAAEKDAVACIAFLDAQAPVDKSQEDWHAGLLYGRPAGGEDRRRVAGSNWCGRVVPRRGTGDRHARESAPARAENQGTDVFRRGVERRHAPARCEEQAARGVCRGKGAGGDRSLSRGPPRLVRPGHAAPERKADLQQA